MPSFDYSVNLQEVQKAKGNVYPAHGWNGVLAQYNACLIVYEANHQHWKAKQKQHTTGMQSSKSTL